MDPLVIVLILVTAVASLLFLVLKLKLHAFISLLLVSIITGYAAGMTPASILTSIQEGMGGTLGFIAVVVGLGAIFGKILEYSGGAEALALFMINKFGEEKAPWALSITGFIIAIPVFLDVAFIILVPILYALSRKTKKSLLFYGIPLLAGLAATHSFIPPTPGPVAVSEILGANLGWVIILGFAVGIPVVILAGPVFGSYISKKSENISPC
jgi:Gnt-I system low-affinity gluconate transporter